MNDDFIYALVKREDYDYIDYFFIKIKEVDRLKFKGFAKDTRGFGWDGEITIKAWVKELYLEVDEYFDVMRVSTIDEYKEEINDQLESLSSMGDRHYLKGKEDYFIKLLNYNFEHIETIY